MPEGAVVIPPDASIYSSAIYVADKTTAAFGKTDVSGLPFKNALRLSVRQPSAESWQIGVSAKSIVPVHRGDVLWITLQARSLESQEEAGEAHADAVFMLKNEAGKEVRPLERRFTCGRDWTTTSIPFVVANDAAAGEAKLVIRYGGAIQKLEVGGITVINCGPAADLTKLPQAGGRYVGFAADAPWRKAAAKRIERIRKGDFPVRVVDAAGKPVAGADVSIKMRRHAFPWGASVDAKRIATGTSPEQVRYREIIETYFNKVVFANDMKWSRWLNQQKKPEERRMLLESIAWLKERRIAIRGHVLVWPSWQFLPATLRELEHDPAALRDAVSAHIKDQTTSLPDTFADWDVLNEISIRHDLLDILGRDIIADWFKEARRGTQSSVLYYNDYTMFQGVTPQSPSQKFYDVIRFLQDKGAPIQAIGEQGHFIGNPPGPAEIISALDRFAKFGLPIQITEFDIDTPDEQLQADFTRDFLTAVFSHPAVTGVIHWEFWERNEGRPNISLWRADGTPRAPGQAWIDLVTKTWWTDTNGKTSADGTYSTRAFYGEYEVTVAKEGTAQTAKLKLEPGAAIQTITLR
jgi:GH35 family endo-1,4-beta-xylanase